MLNVFIAILGQGMIVPILPDYLKQFSAGGSAAGYLVAVIGIIVQVGLIDKVIKRYGEYKLIRVSLLMSAVALILMLVKVNLIYLLVVCAVFFAFNSFLRPTVNTMLSNEYFKAHGEVYKRYN